MPPLSAVGISGLQAEEDVNNLMDNALRHTPEGGRIELAIAHEGSGKVVVRVEDDGTGITSEHLPSLFERDSPLRGLPRKHSGAGLGLLISKRILELHGSTIEAFSARGRGAVFTFSLPTAAPA
ncbi:integral membrane sensor signal transduction histidine kinase [Methylocaldum marinum]|jgi:signal transduction histidine kinase|uniref:histidine kinase n=1 Tax=Methylocaldum marinum TaxID=1432792 RepID=A0A250L1I0_9GAMM|nr:ATP-binding protein [Methylocaldum marinum]BBA36069.1 integral membrane sensor signal transduction histidine kinase [Methylocaldum marinum]